MPDHDTHLDRVRFLARADSRVHILERLATDGPATQRALRDDLDASRTTVARALSALDAEGWVEADCGTYRLSHAGRVVTEEFSALLDTMGRLDDLAAVLRWLPADLDTPAFHRADDVTVTTPTDADPYAPARTQTEILHSADRLPCSSQPSTTTPRKPSSRRSPTTASRSSPS
jgi:DNA-binding transcriptional MocR family regulator